MAEIFPPQSPQWWLVRLSERLAHDQPHFEELENWYTGNHPLPYIPPDLDRRYLEQFREMLLQARTNYMELVVDAVAERLRVQGLRLSASTSPEADDESWAMWQANAMDAGAPLLFTNAIAMGRGYLSVWSADPGSKYPKIAVESAHQCIVEHDPSDRRKRAAALKIWVDDWTGQQRANIYLPNAIYKFRRKADSSMTASIGWVPLEDPKDPDIVKNPTGVVPIIPFYNKPASDLDGQSEIESVLSIQSRINGTVFNRILAAWFTSFRQRWATGIEIPLNDDGEKMEPFKAALDRLWISENADANFGEFGQTDLRPYLEAHERDVQDIAVITRTPRHYLFQTGQSPSGDAIQSAESGLVAKGVGIMTVFSDPLEESMRLGRLFAGNRENYVDSEIIWADPRTKNETANSQAIVTQWNAGLITRKIALEQLGYSPQQIEAMGVEATDAATMTEAQPEEVSVNGNGNIE
jgi:hypothetical protein